MLSMILLSIVILKLLITTCIFIYALISIIIGRINKKNETKNSTENKGTKSLCNTSSEENSTSIMK